MWVIRCCSYGEVRGGQVGVKPPIPPAIRALPLCIYLGQPFPYIRGVARVFGARGADFCLAPPPPSAPRPPKNSKICEIA